jgi:hypothetical protein
MGADKAGQAQTFIQGVVAVAAAGTEQVEAVDADSARRSQDVAGGVSFVPGELVTMRTAAAVRPFFSTALA